MIKNITILAIAALALGGCSTTRTVDINSKPVELNIVQPADPEPVNLIDMKFRVVTKENLDAFVAEQIKVQDNPNPVFVVMSVKDYKALSLNTAELKRYIDQQKKIIIYYKKATAPKSN